MKFKIKMKIKVDIVDFDYINLYMFINENVYYLLWNYWYEWYCIGINLYDYVKKKKSCLYLLLIFFFVYN